MTSELGIMAGSWGLDAGSSLLNFYLTPLLTFTTLLRSDILQGQISEGSQVHCGTARLDEAEEM